MPDMTDAIVRRNLARIKLISIAGPLLLHEVECSRARRLLENCQAWGQELPLVMLAVHGDDESQAAAAIAAGPASGLARFITIHQRGHTETVGNAIALFRREFEPTAAPFAAKRRCLFLTRRGGKGKPRFVSPFTGGEGTTCGESTPPVVICTTGLLATLIITLSSGPGNRSLTQLNRSCQLTPSPPPSHCTVRRL